MTRRLLLLAWLVVVWTALWEDLDLGTVLSGLLVGVLLLVVFPMREASPARMRVRPVALAHLVVRFVWKLIEANAVVAWEVITPSLARVREGIIAVPLDPSPDTVVTVVANLVSLTPGTLTIEVDRDPIPVLYVHVLHLHHPDRSREEVVRLHRMVLRALDLDRPGTAPLTPASEDNG